MRTAAVTQPLRIRHRVRNGVPSPYSLGHQSKLAQDALGEARNLIKAHYYTSSISNSYQVALRSAAGLLYGLNLDPKTEREIRIAFAARFVSSGQSDERFQRAFLRLEQMRELSDFEHDYVGTREEAEEALALAEAFQAEARRLQEQFLK